MLKGIEACFRTAQSASQRVILRFNQTQQKVYSHHQASEQTFLLVFLAFHCITIVTGVRPLIIICIEAFIGSDTPLVLPSPLSYPRCDYTMFCSHSRIQNRRRSICRDHMVPLRLRCNAVMLHHSSFVVNIIHYCTVDIPLIRNLMNCETQVNVALSSVIDRARLTRYKPRNTKDEST
jgi:hypothetical protein